MRVMFRRLRRGLVWYCHDCPIATDRHTKKHAIDGRQCDKFTVTQLTRHLKSFEVFRTSCAARAFERHVHAKWMLSYLETRSCSEN